MKKGQHIYLGPRLQAFGVAYGNVFYGGKHPRVQQAIDQCAAVGGLLVPVKQAASVMRELNFDYAHNMRGTTGKHVTLYQAVERWLNSLKQQNKKQPHIEVKKHA